MNQSIWAQKRLLVVAGEQLAGRAQQLLRQQHFARVLLLEGDWPSKHTAGQLLSVDQMLSAKYKWLDSVAAKLSSQAVALSPDISVGKLGLNPAWLFILPLQYHVLKIIRTIAILRELLAAEKFDSLHLLFQRENHDYYRLLSEQVARNHNVELVCYDLQASAADDSPPDGISSDKGFSLPRRIVASALRLPPLRFQRDCVLFFGQPKLLLPLACEMRRQGKKVVWLLHGCPLRAVAGLLSRGLWPICESGFAPSAYHWPCLSMHGAIVWNGIDLAPLIVKWLDEQWRKLGKQLACWASMLSVLCRTVQFRHVVLSEDMTPFARLTVAATKQLANPSVFVVQHGAPYCRFGFTPGAADYFFAWGKATVERLKQWGVEPARIRAVGIPWLKLSDKNRFCPHQYLNEKTAEKPVRPCVLVFLTKPPRSDRPDAVSLQLNRASYRRMLESLLNCAEAEPGLDFALKPHPRTTTDDILDELLNKRCLANVFVTRRLSPRLFRRCVLVISMMSTAGIEAAWTGLPVIEYVPQGADWLGKRFGFLATATPDNLCALVKQVVAGDLVPTDCSAGEVLAVENAAVNHMLRFMKHSGDECGGKSSLPPNDALLAGFGARRHSACEISVALSEDTDRRSYFAQNCAELAGD